MNKENLLAKAVYHFLKLKLKQLYNNMKIQVIMNNGQIMLDISKNIIRKRRRVYWINQVLFKIC
jgi:hypothetical protein